MDFTMADYIHTGSSSYTAMGMSQDKARRIQKARRSEKAYWDEIEEIKKKQLKLFEEELNEL